MASRRDMENGTVTERLLMPNNIKRYGSGKIWVLYLFYHSAARQASSKRVLDNFQYFIRHGLVASTDPEASIFSLLVCGTEDFVLSVPALANVYVHSLANVSSHGQMSHYKEFLLQPQQFKGCATDKPCSSGDSVLRSEQFSKFLFLSDVVRGPFTPSYVPHERWPSYFTSSLGGSVKLVGATIACEDCGKHIPNCATRLHVESPSFATDMAGLKVLLRTWKVHRSGSSKWSEIWQNEVAGPCAEAGSRSAYLMPSALMPLQPGTNTHVPCP
mmetsp:Transcript_47499/g.94878  ORF Transcript_47499/g.94878 Transcript_47499/m.94878 type:complete len:272 (-) Transcript_47499:726-1541(-)